MKRTHSIKQHLQLGKIKKRKDGKIVFTSNLPTSSCNKARLNLNNFTEFYLLKKSGATNLCKKCNIKYNELLEKLIKLKKQNNENKLYSNK